MLEVCGFGSLWTPIQNSFRLGFSLVATHGQQKYFSVILRVNEFGDQYIIKHEFVKRLQERYRTENIEIPFPIRTVQLEQ